MTDLLAFCNSEIERLRGSYDGTYDDGQLRAYEAVAKRLSALRQHAERGEWVPVSERLPENDDPVWAYYHPVIDGHVFPQVRKLCYSSERNTWLIDGWDGDYNTPIEPEDRVTHWQVIVLPSPPPRASELIGREAEVR